MMLANARRTKYQIADPNIGLELVRATEAAAMNAGQWVGRGELAASDGAASDAMREVLNAIRMRGVVVIGEDVKHDNPGLSEGSSVGTGGGSGFDIAIDPVDGADLLIKDQHNAISVIAASDRGTMLDMHGLRYMDKLAVGPEAADVVDITAPVADNIAKVAKARGVEPIDVTVGVLDRPRHQQLIADIRATGARITLLPHGDVAAGIATAKDDAGIDMLLGTGGAAEGIITACAMKAVGGAVQTRFAPQSKDEEARAKDFGLDLAKVYEVDDLVSGDNTFFVATGITDGWLLDGVRYTRTGVRTRSIVMRSRSGTVRYVESIHRLDRVADTLKTPLLTP